MVSASAVSMDSEKVKVVMSWKRPNSVFQDMQFLGIGRVLDEVH